MFNVSYRWLITGFRESKEPVARPAFGSELEFIDGTKEVSIVYR